MIHYRMNKKFLIIGITTLMIIGLGIFLSRHTVKLTPTERLSSDNTTNPGKSTPPNTTPKSEPVNQKTMTLAGGVIEANEMFALDLYSKYKSKEGNVFFSPYSLSSTLAVIYEGVKGETAKEIQAILHLPDDIQKVRSDFLNINNELNKTDKKYKLTLANALWTQKEYPLVDKFLTTVNTYYDGKVTSLDFKTNTENSRVTINEWVENKTNNKIKELIPTGILSPATRLVITNAIYFKADWAKQFNAENTKDGQFKLSSGSSVNAKMMNQTNYFNYGETSDLQILEMNYLGNDFSMLILLPSGNNLSKLENIFSEAKLNEWKKSMQNREVIVTLPKFKFETKYFMAKDLKDMGMSTAFKYPEADFTGMSPTGELCIDEIIHQTFIEVTEYGTEAAAASAGIMVASAPTTEEPKRFIADHPFIFIIQQKNSGNILFIGRVTDPTKSM